MMFLYATTSSIFDLYTAVTFCSLESEDGSLSSGVVKVLLRHRYGVICTNNWNLSAADVVCRQLGYIK